MVNLYFFLLCWLLIISVCFCFVSLIVVVVVVEIATTIQLLVKKKTFGNKNDENKKRKIVSIVIINNTCHQVARFRLLLSFFILILHNVHLFILFLSRILNICRYRTQLCCFCEKHARK